MSVRLPARAVSAVLTATSLTLVACGGNAEAGGVGEGQEAGGSGSLGAPNASLPDDFGTIQNVRELADGTVLVADPLGGALYHVDLDAGTRTTIGTEGQGPEEYRQPDAVWALPGDSTLLVDLGNGRLTAIGPDLDFGSTSPLSVGDPREGNMVVAIPQGVDGSGNVYAQSMGGGMGAALPDSGSILRIERGSMSVDSVAAFKLQERIRSVTGGPNNQNVSIEQVPLSPQDAWGVAPDGSVVIARSGDYHLEWIEPDGSVTVGPPVDFDPVPIGTAEKEEFVAVQGQSGGGIGISIGITNGVMVTSFSRGGRGGGRREIDQYQWPDAKPPFYDLRIIIDGQDRAWVRRQVEAGEDATYDVFDRQANRIATYTLPNNRRVIGFGAESAYVVAYDEFDLNYLERYDLPGA